MPSGARSDGSTSQGPVPYKNSRGRRQDRRAANLLVQQRSIDHHCGREQAARVALQAQMESAAAQQERADQTTTQQKHALKATARQRDHFQKRARAAREEAAGELQRANALERALERSDADRRAAHSKLDTYSTAGQTALTAVLENPSRLMST